MFCMFAVFVFPFRAILPFVPFSLFIHVFTKPSDTRGRWHELVRTSIAGRGQHLTGFYVWSDAVCHSSLAICILLRSFHFTASVPLFGRLTRQSSRDLRRNIRKISRQQSVYDYNPCNWQTGWDALSDITTGQQRDLHIHCAKTVSVAELSILLRPSSYDT